GSKGLKREIAKNSDLKKFYKVNAMGQAFVVIPDGILNRRNNGKLRQFILDDCYIDAIISLPINTFFRNSKKTYILVLTKKEKNENGNSEKQTDPVFTYLVSEIGESRDINRFDIGQDDLTEAVELFNSFKGNKKNFHKFQGIKSDKRCKLWKIEDFKPDKDWSIADLNTFGELVENVSDRLKDFSNFIKEIGKDENKPNGFKEILLSEIFEIKKGFTKYTNEFINKNSGEYPVYSSQTTSDGVIGKINSYDYDSLIPKNDNKNLLLSYLHFYLSENLKEYAVG
ncbi:18805_t:CDS:2, partial [Funneliformis geosporum]